MSLVHVAITYLTLGCTVKIPKDGITYVAIPRAGSQSIQNLLQLSYDPGNFRVPHAHGCSLDDLLQLGARRIIVAVRDPEERILSGVARRMMVTLCSEIILPNFTKPLGKGENGTCEATTLLNIPQSVLLKEFNRKWNEPRHGGQQEMSLADRANSIVTRARESNSSTAGTGGLAKAIHWLPGLDPAHQVASMVADSKDGIVDLTHEQLSNVGDRSLLSMNATWRASFTLAFVCVRNLTTHFTAVAQQWGLTIPPKDVACAQPPCSKFHTHDSGGKVPAIEQRPLSAINRAWVRKVYAQDMALVVARGCPLAAPL